ncbi:hypothetical protein SDC9_173543 [bioreactor metagenome]|uniref:Uncharacterized protein n=1 Tax=bioreactor metagenome TaxID=1076179 RepID=A0A645GJV5_9ZZZZ
MDVAFDDRAVCAAAVNRADAVIGIDDPSHAVIDGHVARHGGAVARAAAVNGREASVREVEFDVAVDDGLHARYVRRQDPAFDIGRKRSAIDGFGADAVKRHIQAAHADRSSGREVGGDQSQRRFLGSGKSDPGGGSVRRSRVNVRRRCIFHKNPGVVHRFAEILDKHISPGLACDCLTHA